jgi:hypothetical protein
MGTPKRPRTANAFGPQSAILIEMETPHWGPIMHLMTAHRSFVGVGKSGELIQMPPLRANIPKLLRLDYLRNGLLLETGPLAGYTAEILEAGVAFSKERRYLCAEYSSATMLSNRDKPLTWETFTVVSEEEVATLMSKDAKNDAARFSREVLRLRASGEPVKVHCGSGPIPRPGFLNLDIAPLAPNFYISNYDEYFIFPFVESWELPDNCIDYIFHEDFIEHISQLMQIQFLAETRRVLKPGCWHRVNTPNLLTSMKKNSEFSKGFRGVYTGEMQWGHIGLLSPSYLKEIAELVGYREVVYTTRHHGVSPHADKDARPGPDRDDVIGNIYADLMK